MTVTIIDDLDLKKIECSGQAFRIVQIHSGIFRFITGNHILYIKNLGNHVFDIYDTTEDEWKEIWVPYFDLNRDYRSIRKSVPGDDSYLKQAVEFGEGLRILRQDPWEMLITFIISQRKSIPAIKDSVERICKKYGKCVKTSLEEIYLFPSAAEMANATQEELRECKLGYRDTYIMDAISKANSEIPDFDSMNNLTDNELFNKLKEIRGVGDKVANCICLFAYARTASAPVDTWIAKVINNYYGGVNPFPSYGDVAGIMQQYIFYYAQTHKDEF